MAAHLHDLRAEVADPALVAAIGRDFRGAQIDPATRGLLEFADKLTRTPNRVAAADVSALALLGFSDRAITDAVQAIAYFNYINRVADGLGVDAEDFMT
ncbi:MAG: peroxidase [Planctomycetota bacterium]